MKLIFDTNKKIVFTIQVEKIIEALQTCYLGSGTISDPIAADGFVTVNQPDFLTFYSGETIEISFLPEIDGEFKKNQFELLCCKLQNVGQDFNDASVTLLDPWIDIFDISNVHVSGIPDGSLCIAPDSKNICSIVVQDGGSTKTLISYISYGILFSINVDSKKYHLRIDPLLKVSSNPPK